MDLTSSSSCFTVLTGSVTSASPLALGLSFPIWPTRLNLVTSKFLSRIEPYPPRSLQQQTAVIILSSSTTWVPSEDRDVCLCCPLQGLRNLEHDWHLTDTQQIFVKWMKNSYYLLGAYYEPFGLNALCAQSEDRPSKEEGKEGRGLHWGSALGALTSLPPAFPLL